MQEDATEHAGTRDGVIGQLRGLFRPEVRGPRGRDWQLTVVGVHARESSAGLARGRQLPRAPHHVKLHGEKAHKSVSSIGESGDLAFVVVPTSAALAVVEEIADVGTRDLVILTAGSEEAGPAEEELAASLERLATDHDLTVLGPDGNGFINVAGGVAPYGLPIAPALVGGPVGIVLQSGGVAGYFDGP